MTEKEKKIEEEVKKTLEVLDDYQQSQVNPFFFAKLEHRMRSQEEIKTGIWQFAMPKLALATLIILFFCNVFTMVNQLNSTDENSGSGLENFAEQYYLTTSQ